MKKYLLLHIILLINIYVQAQNINIGNDESKFKLQLNLPKKSESNWIGGEIKSVNKNQLRISKITEEIKGDGITEYYLEQGDYTINIWFDTTLLVFFEDSIHFNNSVELTYLLTEGELSNKNIRNLVGSIENDTLVWIQEEDNSWFTRQDSLLIYKNERSEGVLEWHYQKNTRIEEKINHKVKLTDDILNELMEIEKTLVYPDGINDIVISTCSFNDGIDWYQELKIGKINKIYYSIECGNHRWSNMREKIIGKIE